MKECSHFANQPLIPAEPYRLKLNLANWPDKRDWANREAERWEIVWGTSCMLMLLEPQLLVKPVCLHLAVFSECSSGLHTIWENCSEQERANRYSLYTLAAWPFSVKVSLWRFLSTTVTVPHFLCFASPLNCCHVWSFDMERTVQVENGMRRCKTR